MKKKILVLFLFSLLGGVVVAQPRHHITERRESASTDRTNFYTAKGNRPGVILTLEGEKQHPGTMTVFVHFYGMENCNIDNGTKKYELKHTPTQLAIIRPVDQAKGTGNQYGYRYQYWSRWFYGQVDREPDTAFVYRFPCAADKPVRVIDAVDESSSEGSEKVGSWFIMERGDTVYAIRRGIVTKIERRGEFDGRANITVEQPDGSNARYTCLDAGNLSVAEGDEILPSTPLGLAGTDDAGEYGVSVQIYRYVSDPADPMKHQDRDVRDVKFVPKGFLPLFATTEGVVAPEHDKVYTPVMTDQMAMREMTKKEKKRFQSRK